MKFSIAGTASPQVMRSVSINCQARKEFWTNEYPPGMPQKVEPGCMAYYH